MSDFASMGEGQVGSTDNVDSGSVKTAMDSGGDTTSDYSWVGDVPDDDRGYLENKGFKAPQDLLKAYRNLESFHGVGPDKLMKLPDEGGDMNDIYNRLGRPEDTSGYKVDIEGFQDTPLTEMVKEIGHKHGMPSSMYSELVSTVYEAEQKAQQEQEQSRNVEYNNEVESMKKEHGTKYDEIVGSADRAVRALGLDDESRDALVQAMGPKKAVEMFNKVYSSLGEDTVNSVNNEESYGKTAVAVDQEISQLMRDVGNDPARKRAFDTKSGDDFARWKRLDNTRDQMYRE